MGSKSSIMFLLNIEGYGFISVHQKSISGNMGSVVVLVAVRFPIHFLEEGANQNQNHNNGCSYGYGSGHGSPSYPHLERGLIRWGV